MTLLYFLISFSFMASAQQEVKLNIENPRWESFENEIKLLERADYQNGLSYVISGSLALAGGLWGEAIADDSVEKGIYAVFQSIGIASVGYGAYLWQVGGEERALYHALAQTQGLSDADRTRFLRTYFAQRKQRLKREKLIRAITHGLVAGVNIYNATRQDERGVRDALYFIGGINVLAAVSFSFDF